MYMHVCRRWQLDTIEMFTDFLTECRAHKMQLNLSGSVDLDSAQQVAPRLTLEVSPRVTVAAAA